MLAYSEPPGYQRTVPIKRPKLDAFTDQIDIWLAEDKQRPRKQRHTAKRIFDRLRSECDFTGGYTIVKDYVRTEKRGGKEMFVPLSHPAGHGQADFGEALVVIGGVEQKAYFFAFDLPYSDACYVRAYPRANTEAWLPVAVFVSMLRSRIRSLARYRYLCALGWARLQNSGTRMAKG